MTFAGSNLLVFDYMEAAKLHPTGARIYLDEAKFPGYKPGAWPFPNSIPAAWPTIKDPDAGEPITAHACVSIRPDLELLLGLIPGQPSLDTALRAFLVGKKTGAPGGPTSLLGLWHESSTAGPAGVYKYYFTYLDGKYKEGASGLLQQAQTYIQAKARLWKANVKIGAIEVVGSAKTSHLAAWMAKDLDFYACDIYDNKATDAHPFPMLGAFKDTCDGLMPAGKTAVLGVTETNTRKSGRRPWWFHTVWSWLQTRGYTSNSSCFLTFWRLKATESGGWRPNDEATIAALREIFEHSSP